MNAANKPQLFIKKDILHVLLFKANKFPQKFKLTQNGEQTYSPLWQFFMKSKMNAANKPQLLIKKDILLILLSKANKF